MRRIDLLIDQSRRATENEDYTENSGIDPEEFIQYINDGQDRIESAINSKSPMTFIREKEIDIVQNQEAYDMPFDIYMGTNIVNVEFSNSGRISDYYRLKQRQIFERINSSSGSIFPSFFIRRNNQVMLQPPAATGKIRVNYVRKLPRLDIRRGTVLSVSLDITNKKINSLILDEGSTLYSEELSSEEYLTVVDRLGNIKMAKVLIDGVASNGVVTVDSSFVYDSGETIEVGDYVARGNNSTTHSMLSDICERYLVSYMNWKILKRDSSVDSEEQERELSGIESDILNMYSEPDSTHDGIPIINSDDFYVGEWW